jgi:hypothetical protein
MEFGHMTVFIVDDAVRRIDTQSPLYTFTNGLRVGASEDKVKQAFGTRRGDYLAYEDKGVSFAIREKDRTLTEIHIFPPAKEMTALPKYNPDSGAVVDLRGRDLSKLDLRHSAQDLMYTEFDSRTVWPARDKMPSDFDPQRIMELGKNPGLGVRRLHEEGITGRGVRIAILDQPLLVDHQEYADRLRLYEEIHAQDGQEPASHGCMAASIAVGKTVGVAPEAELFFVTPYEVGREEGDTPTLGFLAQGIQRILEINEQLPQDGKIRVISISNGWTRSDEGYDLIMEAVQKARAAGMLVVCTAVELVHDGCDYDVLGRSPLANPDVFESYEPALYAAESFWATHDSPSEGTFFVPVDSRTTASDEGIDEYVFDRGGGSSKAPPYIAGVYALAIQVDPGITPGRFWALAARTGRTIELQRKGKRRLLGPIIDPVRLIRQVSGELMLPPKGRSHNSLPLARKTEYQAAREGVVRPDPQGQLGEDDQSREDDDGHERSSHTSVARRKLDEEPIGKEHQRRRRHDPKNGHNGPAECGRTQRREQRKCCLVQDRVHGTKQQEERGVTKIHVNCRHPMSLFAQRHLG